MYLQPVIIAGITYQSCTACIYTSVLILVMHCVALLVHKSHMHCSMACQFHPFITSLHNYDFFKPQPPTNSENLVDMLITFSSSITNPLAIIVIYRSAVTIITQETSYVALWNFTWTRPTKIMMAKINYKIIMSWLCHVHVRIKGTFLHRSLL